MLAELQELGLGLVSALVILAGLAWLIGKTQRNPSPVSPERSPVAEADAHHHAVVDGLDAPPPTDMASYRGPGVVAQIFVATQAGATMHAVPALEALAHHGLAGDRYSVGRGRWSESDNCDVTLIAQEDLDAITSTTGVRVQDGEHRRNLVTRGVHLPSLAGRRFRVGSAYFAYDRPRPPCQYIQQITQPGMVKALAHRSGICVRCFKSGVIRRNDRIVVLNVSVLEAIKVRLGLSSSSA